MMTLLCTFLKFKSNKNLDYFQMFYSSFFLPAVEVKIKQLLCLTSLFAVNCYTGVFCQSVFRWSAFLSLLKYPGSVFFFTRDLAFLKKRDVMCVTDHTRVLFRSHSIVLNGNNGDVFTVLLRSIASIFVSIKHYIWTCAQICASMYLQWQLKVLARLKEAVSCST